MKLELLPENHPLLKTKSKDHSFEDTGFVEQEFINEMKRVMKENNGIGLSAIQVGIPLNIFMMHDTVVVNPKIINKSENSIKYKEGCLSFPGIYLEISRKAEIEVEYYDREGKLIKQNLYGTTARIFLHEFDHLNAILFDSKVPKREFLKAKMKRVVK